MSSFRARMPLIGLIAFGLLVPVLFFALAPGASAATSKTRTIWTETAHPAVTFKTFDSNPMKVFDIDRDGDLELIANNDNQWVYVFDSRNGDLLFEAKTTFPSGWGARTFNGPEVAAMTEGGTTRLIVANSASYVTSYRFTGSSPGEMTFVKEWERRADDCFSNPGMDAKPVLADLDKDGDMEILANTEESGLIALRTDGSLFWKKCIGGGNAEPAVADVTNDGWPDVVHVSDAGMVTVLNGRTGATQWSYNVKANFNLRSASIPVGPGIGQLNGLGGPDIVVVARDSHDLENYENNHALMVALSGTGQKLWHFQDMEQGNPLNYGHPVVVDADKNGANEVYWGDWNTIGHKGGIPPEDSWQTTGPANFYRMSNTGAMVWRQTLNTYWNNKDIVLADVDDDGVQEVLANGPGTGGDGIWYLNSNTGAKEAFITSHPWKVARGPIVADLWGTGTMQWVIEAGAGSTSVYGGALIIYDTHVPYDSVYPHLPYPTFGGGPPTTPLTTTLPPPTTTTQSPTTTLPPGGSSKEAELFATKTTGGLGSSASASAGQYWNLWSNGHIQDTLTGDGVNGLQVVARGTPLGGVWPTMVVSVDGVTTASFTVDSSTWVIYGAPALPLGTHTVRVAFTNDAASSTEDRNLHLDVVRVGGGSPPPTTTSPPPTTTSPPPTTTVPPGGSSKEAELFATKSTGGLGSSASASAGKYWNVWSDGHIQDTLTGDGTSGLQVVARGTELNGVWPTMVVSYDGTIRATFTVNAATWTTYTAPALPTGSHTVRIAFTNDASSSTGDRNLHLDVVRFGSAPPPTTTPPTTTPPGGAFTATFQVSPNINNWWVEVTVTTDHTLSKVEAQTNGGAWVQLNPTDWGTWAKSYNVPSGSEVVFRATDTGGSIAISPPVTWP